MFALHKIAKYRKDQAYHRQPKLAASSSPAFILTLYLLKQKCFLCYVRACLIQRALKIPIYNLKMQNGIMRNSLLQLHE